MYSYRIEQAIRAACVLHAEQTRKGSVPLPYITHLFSVACMLHDYTTNEDVIIAALLHDAVEDSDYSLEELEEDFGSSVRDIVAAVSEPYHDGDQKLSWVESKKRYAKQLKQGPIEAVMVAAADKAHNFRTVIEELSRPQPFYAGFGKHLDERLEVYQDIANAINSRLSGPLLTEFNYVFEQYKTFIYDIKTAIEPK